jgi:hypothetical protein
MVVQAGVGRLRASVALPWMMIGPPSVLERGVLVERAENGGLAQLSTKSSSVRVVETTYLGIAL